MKAEQLTINSQCTFHWNLDAPPAGGLRELRA